MSQDLTSPLALEALSVEFARKKHTRHIKKRKKSDRAFGYARYSDDGQDPMSIDRQVEIIMETNRKWGLPEPTMFIDAARTGKNNGRNGAQGLFEELDAHYAASLTLESGDRAFRSLLSYAGFQDSFARNGTRLYTWKGPLQAEMVPLEAVMSVMEVQRLQQRFAYGRKIRKKTGTYNTNQNFGFVRDGRKLVPDPELQEHVVDMFQLAASGMGPAEIARVLIKKGVKPPRAMLWHPETVLGILTNSIYDGRTMYNAETDENT